MDIVRPKGDSLVNSFSWMRRKSCKLPSRIPLVVSKRCICSLESLQQTGQAASSNPSASLINGIPQERTGKILQKFIFPKECKETSVRLSSIPVLKDSIVLCEHHLTSDVRGLLQDGDESTNLIFVDRDELLSNAGRNLEHNSCTTEAFSRNILDQNLERDLQNKTHFSQEAGRGQHCTEERKPTVTCARVSSEVHQGSCERSKWEQDSRAKFSSFDRMPRSRRNRWIINYKPNSDINFTYADAVLVTGER